MHINWLGNYTIKIQSGDKQFVIDPHSGATGLPPFRGKTDIVVLTNPTDPSMSYTDGIQGDALIISSPGEYSVGNATLHALGWHDANNQERSLHRWHIEGMVLLYLGSLNRKLTDEELQELEKTNIDILFVPVGGGAALNADEAVQVVTTIEPRIVIPIHYDFGDKRLKEKLEPVDHFAKEIGADPKDVQPKALIKENKLPQEGMETLILSPDKGK